MQKDLLHLIVWKNKLNMKFSLLLLLSLLQGFTILSQENSAQKKSCFEVPKSIKTAEINNIQISNECMITSFSFQLFNRWGELMRESSKLTNPIIFDGHQNEVTQTKKKKKSKKNTSQNLNKPLSEGVYFYTISFTLQGIDKSEKQTGYITIL